MRTPIVTLRTFVVTMVNPISACARVMVTVLSRGGEVLSIRFDSVREGGYGVMMLTIRGGNRNLYAHLANLPDVVTLLELDQTEMDPAG